MIGAAYILIGSTTSSSPISQTYPIHLDTRGLLEDVKADQAVVLPFASQYVLILEPTFVVASNARIYGMDERGQIIQTGVVQTETFAGTVEGVSGSKATLTIDPANDFLAGSILVNDGRVDFAYDAQELTIRSSPIYELSAPQTAESTTPELLTQIFISVWADDGYQNFYGASWHDRPIAAYNELIEMWAGVEIQFTVEWFFAFTGTTLPSDCVAGISSFRNTVHLMTDRQPSDPQQMFSGTDFDGCHGMATTDSFAGDAYSTIEGIDKYGFDGYDPSLPHDLAMVAGQELSHNIGEEMHVYGQRCDAGFDTICFKTTHNIMHPSAFEWKMGAWHMPESKGRINDHMAPYR